MIEIMKERRYYSRFISPLSGLIVILSLLAFVDDTELFLTDDNDDPEKLLQRAEQAINVWRELLYVTGGIMRSSKCSWTMIAYNPTPGTAKIIPDSKNPGVIHLPDENGQLGVVPRYSSDNASRYLGVFQTTSGNEDRQVDELHAKVENWNQMIENSRLPPALNLHAVLARIHRTLLYPLVATTITEDKLQAISDQLYWKSLPKCGIVRTFPIQYRHLPIRYQGLGLPNLYLEQEISKLREIMTISDTDSVAWDQLRLGLEGIQVQVGVPDIIFNHSYNEFSILAEECWIKSHWKFLSSQGYSLQSWKEKQSTKRRNDSFIMCKMIESSIISDADLKKINRCRLYLRAWTISDMASGDGKTISQQYYNGYRDESRGTGRHGIWKDVKRPNVNYWFVWKQFLTKVYCIDEGQPLGEWEKPPSNTWEWYYDPITSFLYSIQSQKVMIYERIYTRGDSTRTGGLWFGNPIIKRRREFTQSTAWFWRATVGEISRGRAKVKCDGWYKHKYEPANLEQLPISNVLQLLEAQKVPQWMFKHGNTHTISIPTLKQMFSQPLRLVTDASYENGAGSACVIIET